MSILLLKRLLHEPFPELLQQPIKDSRLNLKLGNPTLLEPIIHTRHPRVQLATLPAKEVQIHPTNTSDKYIR